MYIYLPVCLSVHPSVCLFVHPSSQPSVFLSVCWSVGGSVCLSVCLYIYILYTFTANVNSKMILWVPLPSLFKFHLQC